MKLKIVLINILFLTILSFSVSNTTDYLKTTNDNKKYEYMYNEDVDKAIIVNEKANYGYFKNINLIDANLVKIDNNTKLELTYDLEIVYIYKNTKIIRSTYYYVYHPINNSGKINFQDYLENLKIYSEVELSEKMKNYKKLKKIDLKNLIKYNFEIENNENIIDLLKILETKKENKEKTIEVQESLYYLPYIEFDDEGYAYIKGTSKRITAQKNILISYFPKEDESLIEFVNFENGRMIPMQAYIKKGFIEIASLHEDGEEIIKNIKFLKNYLGVNYKEEEIIAKIIFKDHKIIDTIIFK